VGFHLQQAAEKALKAVLVAGGRFPPKVHDLKALADQVAVLEPSLLGWDARLLPLNDYSVAERYPTAGMRSRDLGPLIDETREFVALVRRILGG